MNADEYFEKNELKYYIYNPIEKTPQISYKSGLIIIISSRLFLNSL